jgi:hypothetical protein
MQSASMFWSLVGSPFHEAIGLQQFDRALLPVGSKGSTFVLGHARRF